MTASYYSDGRSGQKRAVNLVFGADGIRFLDDNELLISFWSYEGLNLIGAVSRATPFQLRHERFKEASLTCDDPTVLQKLKNICPQIKSTLTYPVVRSIRRLIALALAATVFIYMSMFSIKMLAQQITGVIPTRWEQALGTQISKRMVEETGVCSATPGVKALQHLSNRITSVLSLSYPLHVQITDDARVDSFALSGGAIVIYRGMLEETRSSEEFAGLLAHEVAHSAERHPLEGMIRSLGLSFIISSYVENLSTLAFSSASFKNTMVKSKYTGANEAVADVLSVQILEAAKISPRGLSDLFSRLNTDRSGAVFLSRHENAGTGIVVGAPPKGSSGSALSATEWAALKNICADKIVLRPS